MATLNLTCLSLTASCGFLSLLITMMVNCSHAESDHDNPEIMINQSTIRGKTETYDGKAYWSFKGIRFGEPPLGKDRFQRPKLADLPPLVIAERYGNSCHPVMKTPGVTEEFDEDCLFLNVFCPPLNNTGNLQKAVTIYIHGGGNIMGTVVGRDGPHLVTGRDVIFVTFNYRLGPLGFLSVHDSAGARFSGNAGLFDQNAAIVWTKKYIQHFGGDPDRITLIGESAGAKGVAAQTVSPYSRDLFQRAIMFSGTFFSPSFYAWDPEEAARVVAKRLSCPSDTPEMTIQCLQKANADNLMRMAINVWPQDNMRSVLDFGWGAVRDNDFIPDSIEAGMFKGDVLLGANNNEGTMYSVNARLVAMNDPAFSKHILEQEAFKNEFLNVSLYQYFLSQPKEALVDAAYDVYVGQAHQGPVDIKMLMNFYADQQYIFPAIEYLDRGISAGNSYFYYFDRVLKKYKDEPPFMQGSHHVDDTFFILGGYDVDGYSQDQKDIEDNVAEGMQIYITNFVKTGNPNQPTPPPVHFEAYDGDQTHPRGAYLRVTGNTNSSEPNSLFDGNKSNLLPERMGLWSNQLAPFLRKEMKGSNATSTVTSLGCVLVFTLISFSFIILL